MRFKFRAWDKERNEMRIVKLMNWSDWWVSTGSTWERSKPLKFGERNSFNNEQTDRHILMQCTGLTDSNNIEIYEGDILEDFISKQRYEVIWDYYGMFLFNPVGTEGNAIDYYEFEDETTSATIVIGNIYENPQFLKEESTFK